MDPAHLLSSDSRRRVVLLNLPFKSVITLEKTGHAASATVSSPVRIDFVRHVDVVMMELPTHHKVRTDY